MRVTCVIAALFCLAWTVFGQSDTSILAKYEKDLAANRNSSITHFHIAEIRFQQSDFQAAANEFREALNGDLEPRWVEVWSFLNLGKIHIRIYSGATDKG